MPAPQQRDTKGDKRMHIPYKMQGERESAGCHFLEAGQAGAQGAPEFRPDCGLLELLRVQCASVSGYRRCWWSRGTSGAALC